MISNDGGVIGNLPIFPYPLGNRSIIGNVGQELYRRIFYIKLAAGRMNFSWNNPDGRLWTFPAGTVIFDTTTPISTSTDATVNVNIPVGGGIATLETDSWAGAFDLNDNATDQRYLGDLSDLPPLTSDLRLALCSLVTGDLSNLPNLTSNLNLQNCTLVTGDLSNLPNLTGFLSLFGCSLVTGDLADLPSLTSALSLALCSLVTGDLSNLPNLTSNLNLQNCTLVTGAYTNVSGTNVPSTTNLTDTGLSATDMDATLIAYAACTKTGGTFTAVGMTRTSASNAAVAHLTTAVISGGLGWTVVGITVV